MSILILGSEKNIAKQLAKQLCKKYQQIVLFESKDLIDENNVRSLFSTEYDIVFQFADDPTINISSIINNNIVRHINCKKVFLASNVILTHDKEFIEKQYLQLVDIMQVYIGRLYNLIDEFTSSPLKQFIDTCSNFYPWGDISKKQSFIYVDDAITAIIKLVTELTPGITTISSNLLITFDEFKKIVMEVRKTTNTIKPLVIFQNELSGQINNSVTEITYTPKSIISLLVNNKDKSKKLENILFVTQPNGIKPGEKTFCGIGIRGKLLAGLLEGYSTKYNYIPVYIVTEDELEKAIIEYNPKGVIYNFNKSTLLWILDPTLRLKYPTIKYFFIHYDVTNHLIANCNPSYFPKIECLLTENHLLTLPSYIKAITRAQPKVKLIKELPPIIIPTIGFQGFALEYKGLTKLANIINKEFERAIIRLHCIKSEYSDTNNEKFYESLDMISSQITKTNIGIKIEMSQSFKTDEELVKWLRENTVNCYFYEDTLGGLASSPTYGLAAGRPIAITRTNMLQDFWDLTPTIEIEKTTLKKIISNGIEPLLPLYERNTHENLIKSFDNLFS